MKPAVAGSRLLVGARDITPRAHPFLVVIDDAGMLDGGDIPHPFQVIHAIVAFARIRADEPGEDDLGEAG